MIEIDGERCFSSRGAAALLRVGRNNLLKFLRNKKIFDSKNIPTDAYWGRNWFRCQKTEHNGRKMVVTYFTSYGIEHVRVLVDTAVSNGDLKRKNKEKIYDDINPLLIEEEDQKFYDLCLDHEIDVNRAFSAHRKNLRKSKKNKLEKNLAIDTLKKEMKNVYKNIVREINYDKEG